MGDPSGPIEENGGQNGDTDGPSSLIGMGPPSPLTGCYLLIILGEPHSAEHKDIILQRLVKGFLSWDALQTHVDLEEELNTITVHAPEGEDARHGERLIQYASENLVTEILIHPQYNTLIQCMRNLLSSFTRHRHIIHAGYTFSGNGSWILQDGTFSVSDFAEAFQEHEVQRVLRAYPDTVSMDIHCDSSAGLWNVLPDKNYAKTCKIRINPVDVLESGSDRIKAFIDYLAPMLNPANLNDLLESSDVVGNIRFSHPTLYVFPGGQGDAALFGINGFNMLVDGGFNRKACFWNFARHLDRLDAVLMTRINNSNIQGISSVIERKHNSHVYPGIGHFFCNIPERRAISSPEENKDKDSLVIDLFDKGQKMISHLKSINLKPQMCYRDIEPMNLYHKVGHGTLDMYVISPGKDSREVKDFIQKWTTNDQKLFAAKDTKDFQFPIQNLVSICALLVWQPANPEDSITRILFPGSTPDYKIIEGLEKIKHLEFMKHPMCTAKKLVPSISTATITKKVLKSAINEKSIPEPILPSKTTKAEKDNQVIDNKVKNIQDNKAKESKLIEEQTVEKKVPIKSKPKKIIPKKADSLDEKQKDDIIENKDKDEDTVNKPEVVINGNEINDTDKKDETDTTAKPKKIDQKSKIDTRAPIKSRIDSKPPKSMDKKSIKRDTSEKKEVGKSSPTTTPKKTSSDAKLTNGVPKEKEIKPKIVSRVTKSSPSSTPAKSTKEANNRKVLESKQKAKTIKREIVKTIEKKEEKIERKPISHRTKGISPSRRPPDSPKKSIKPKTEKDNIIRKAKLDKGGTTDSSLVSTPSADDALSSKKIVDVVSVDDVVKQRELDDLKEEQEAVREIEEVFKREEKSKKKDLSSDHREVAKQDSATEAEDDEEYLIIEKEEVEQYTEDSINEQESSMTKEEEIQKHQRDSQESEKKRRKTSLQTTEEEVEPKDEVEAANVVDGDDKHVDIIEPENDNDDVQPDSIEEVAGGKLEPEEQEHIKEEVQEIISSAKEIAKTKSDSKEEVAKTEEISSPTPEDKLSSEKKTSDTKDDLDPAHPAKDGEVQNLPESQPFSATVESGATTAPTLPEDERIPLDEIKEDLVVEEKYIKEETKEAKEPEVPTSSVLQKTYEPLERAVPTKMQFDATQPHLRDIVKTPDEVADLPVHEEADIATYEGSEEAKDDKKTTETKSSDEAKHQVEESTETVEKNLKNEKIPNGSVINKAENEKLEEKELDEAVGHAEEKPTFEKTFDKKLDVTGFKEKDSTMAEKVEYAVEDLGKSFENTLKDVTHKDDKIQAENVKEIVTKDSVEQAAQIPATESKTVTEVEMEIKETKILLDVQEAIQTNTEPAIDVDDATQKEESKDLKDIVDKAVAGVSSFIESVSKDITEKVESFVEASKVELESKIESQEIQVDKDQLEFKEVFDYSHPYGLKNFPTELRETHITTLDSPVAEKDKIIDLKILDKLPEAIDEEHDDLSGKSMVASFHPDDFKYASFEREDSNLKDIKEEEEDDRSTPPNDQAVSRKESTEISDLTNKDTITVIVLDEQPPRAVSPREEEVLKIVANVAEVLKSEKDIAEIIPDFSEEELERKLRGASPRPEDESGTVQRMLVTTSSEDGGEEIEICPEGTIKFSPAATTPELLSGKVTPDVPKDVSDVKSDSTDIKSEVESVEVAKKESMEIGLEKSDEKEEKETSDSSTPEAKTSSVSIDEKEKHELPEKAQGHDITTDKLPEIVNETVARKSLTESVSRKESVVSDYIDDIMDRRESEFSAFSEKDFTKDESSMDDSRPPSAISHDLKSEKEEDNIPKTLVADVTDVERPASEQSNINDQSPEEKSVISKDDKKQKDEEKSPTLSDLKVEVSDERRESTASHVSDKSGVEISRPDSIISHFSDRSEPELKEKLGSSPDSIASIDKAMAYSKLVDQSVPSKTKEFQTQPGTDENEDGDKTPVSRPESVASHVSDADKTEEFDTLRASSVTSPKDAKVESNAATPICLKDDKPATAPPSTSPVSEKEEKNLQESASVKSDGNQQDDSRPLSAASNVSDKAEAKRSDSKLDDNKEVDRPSSAASHISDKQDAERTESVSSKLDNKQEDSRPPSIASRVSDKEEATLQESASVKSDGKQPDDSRPQSITSQISDREDKRSESVSSKLEDKQDVSRPPSTASHVSDKEEGKRPESASSNLDGKQDVSRPPSIASHISDKEEAKQQESVASKLNDKQDDSRASSVASHVSDKEEAKRPESVSSKLDDKQDSSRPPSIASHVSEKQEFERRESVSSKLEEKQDVSRPPSTVSNVSDKGETKRPESVSSKLDEKQHDSRPPSNASHTSDKEEVNLQESASIKSDGKQQGDSRPQSIASHISDKDEAILQESISSKLEEKQDVSRPSSIVSHVSDKEETKRPESVSSKPDVKQDDSRPQSVASHISDKEEAKRPESVSSKPDDKQDDSRPPSVASHVSDKREAKRPESVSSKPDVKQDDSRPQSVASHISDKGEAKRPESVSSNPDDKQDSTRPPSVASHISDKGEAKRPESVSSKPDDKQDDSRPSSVASHISDKGEAKRPESVSSKQDVKQDDSRPPSGASHISDKGEVKRPESVSSKPDVKQDDSRPPSVASHISDKGEAKRPESVSSKPEDKQDNSRPPSVVSHISDKGEEKRPESVSSKLDDKKGDYRPPSVGSCISDKEEVKRPESVCSKLDVKQDDSRPPSIASHVSDKDEVKLQESASVKSDGKQQDDSRPQSMASHVSDKEEAKRPESVNSKLGDNQNDSRPSSVASHIDEVKRPESISSKLDDKQDDSHPPSIASDKGEAKRPESVSSIPDDKQDGSRPTSVASYISDKEEVKRPESVCSKLDVKQDDSRPPSIASHVSDKDEVKLQESDGKQQDDSRPQSMASHVSDKEEAKRPESVNSKLGDNQNDSRPPSVASHISDKQEVKRSESVSSKLDGKQDDSRPPSIASHISDKGEEKRPESVSSKLDDKKDDSRPPSVGSYVSDKEEAKVQESASLKSDDKQQDESRPQSMASHVSDKGEAKRPESVNSKLGDKQDDSRPPSNASHVSDREVLERPGSSTSKLDDKKDVSRPPSTASHVGDKEEAKRPESVSSKLDDKQDVSRSPSIASHVSDKEEPKRPDSVSSNLDDKQDSTRPPSNASSKKEEINLLESASTKSDSNQQYDSRPQSIASHISDKEEMKRPESVSSKLDDKHDDSRPPSSASRISDKEETKLQESASVKSDGKQQDDSRPQSIASNVSDKEELKRPESVSSTLGDNKDVSRPPSIASHISDKEEAKRPESVNSKLSEKQNDSRPPSIASHVSEKEETQRLDIKISRPGSAASNVSDSQQVSNVTNADMRSRPESAASHVSDQQVDLQKSSRPASVSSHKSDDNQQRISRPASVASNESENENENSQKLTEDHRTQADERPDSRQSHTEKLPSDAAVKQKDSRPASVLSSVSNVNEKDALSSRPGSVTSFVSEKDFNQRRASAASQASESRNQSRRESAVERCSVDDDDEMEILKVKDSRSKSVSSIMMTSMYKPDGFEPMTTFQESFEQSKDDSEVGSSSRKASGLSNLIDDVKKIDAKLVSSKIEDKTSEVSPETEMSDKISTETIPSEQSSPSESKLQAKLESMPGSSLEAPKSSAESLSGKSTPDVADIERKFFETSTKTISETKVLDSSTSKHEVDVLEDHDFDHISTTEKLSKRIEVTSESSIKSSSSTTHTKSTTSSSELQSQSLIKEGAINKDVTSIKSEFRSYTPSSDDFDVQETNSPRSDVSSGHVRLVCGWTGSDDEITNSPLSTTSQAPCSPPSKFTYETEYELQRSSSGVSKKSEFDIDDSEDDVPPEYGSKEVESAIPIHASYKSDPMETSFYGKLPESEPIPITTSVRTVITKQYDEYTSSEPDSSSCVSRESVKSSSDHRFLDEADLDFEKALEEHRQVRGTDVMSSVTSKYEFSPSKQPLESAKTTEFPLSGVQKGKSIDSKSDAPTTSEVQTKSAEQIQKEKADERVSSWGKPLGLPSPVPIESQTTPKRERKLMISKTKMNNEKNLRKRSESPIKGKKVTPIYMDLTYVPHNGNSYYSHVEFFKRVRARYYVFSGTEPSRDVYNALLEAKQTWEDKELEVTIIPTYDTDVLGYWVSENEDLLAKYHIDLSPSASRCTINLQDHETSCSAYRLEF